MNSRELFVKITEKWPVKVLSLAAALLISLYYNKSTLEERSFSVPLRVESTNSLVPADYFKKEVTINLRAKKNEIYSKIEDDIEAYIDLSKYKSEETPNIPVQIRKKGSALGIEPLEITVKPSSFRIKIENKLSRNIMIMPSFKGFVAEGYERTRESINPSSIIAEGPRSKIESLSEINTELIDLDGRYESFTVLVNIIVNDPLIITYGNKTIEYRAEIKKIAREPPAPIQTFKEAEEE
jgi:YbbR domain-containing protein